MAPGGGSLATVVTAAVPLTAVVPSATPTLTLTLSIAAVVPTAALDLTAAVPGALALAPVAVSVFAARGRCRGLARAVSALEPPPLPSWNPPPPPFSASYASSSDSASLLASSCSRQARIFFAS